MLPERAIRLTEAAYIEPARQFFAPRMLALLNQVMELRREHARRTGGPLDIEPVTESYTPLSLDLHESRASARQ